jgi:hypothetical protein
VLTGLPDSKRMDQFETIIAANYSQHEEDLLTLRATRATERSSVRERAFVRTAERYARIVGEFIAPSN